MIHGFVPKPGTPRGTNKNDKTEHPVQDKEVAILDNIKKAVKNFLKTIAWVLLIVAAESTAIYYLWNYVFPDFYMSYIKTYALVIMIRLIFRNTVTLDKDNK